MERQSSLVVIASSPFVAVVHHQRGEHSRYVLVDCDRDLFDHGSALPFSSSTSDDVSLTPCSSAVRDTTTHAPNIVALLGGACGACWLIRFSDLALSTRCGCAVRDTSHASCTRLGRCRYVLITLRQDAGDHLGACVAFPEFLRRLSIERVAEIFWQPKRKGLVFHIGDLLHQVGAAVNTNLVSIFTQTTH